MKTGVACHRNLTAGQGTLGDLTTAGEVASPDLVAVRSDAVIARRTPRALSRGSWSLQTAKEVFLVGALYCLYRVGRELSAGQDDLARDNAGVIHSFESWLSLPSGASVQGWFSDGALHVANIYYVSAHFPVTVSFLVWGFAVRPRIEYVWARRLLVLQTFLALLLHIAVPLAPPRMFPEWGFRDTMAAIGPSAYDGASAAVSNQFAAMPSLHVGWAVLVAVVVGRTTTGPLRVLAGAHAVVTFVVVIVTANHWWSDGAVAIGLLGIGLCIFPGPARAGRLSRAGRQEPSRREKGAPIARSARSQAREPHAAR